MPPKAAKANSAAAAPAPAKKAASTAASTATAAPKKAAAGGQSSATGIYVGPIDVRNQSALEVRNRFSAYGPVAQLRMKRTNKAKHPFVLVWYKTAEDAKKAFAEIQRTEPAGTGVEWIRSAKPVEPRHTYTSTLHINPINVPTRSSKGYGKLVQKVREVFPEAVKTRLHKENDGTGSALVYFKDNAASKAAKGRINGKLFDKPVVVKPSCRTVEKDKNRFVKPLQDRAEYKKALDLKIAEEKQTEQTRKLALAKAIKDAELQKVAGKKAFDAVATRAKDEKKQALHNALPNSAVKERKAPLKNIVSKSAAPAKLPPAKTAQNQPIQKHKVPSKKH